MISRGQRLSSCYIQASMADARVFPLKCAVQQYAWGKIGTDSEVAKLSVSGDDNFQVEENKPYAELWMGTHPNGPSQIISKDIQEKSLADWISKHPDCLGSKVNEKFKGRLPYLFKVLSVNKALSIQAHPNKNHAEKLHAERPDIYKDPNHKPEMAVALTPFEGMCGFRPLQEIIAFLQDIPEFREIVGQEAANQLLSLYKVDDPNSSETCKSALRQCFTGMMTCKDEIVAKQLSSLVDRLSKDAAANKDISKYNGELLLKLHCQFPGDVGCFSTYFLNHLILQPGEAMFLGPNEPHAYIGGNCTECMACSDNVVRAGLTPKYKDVPTLCEMLTYIPGTPKEKLFPSVQDPSDGYVTIYNPPVPDFSVARISVPENIDLYKISAYDSPSILLVIEGEAEGSNSTLPETHQLKLKKGTVIFISANQEIALKIKPGGLLMFRAYCPLD
ncbi:mannose-6-phosphate isomerase-like [Ptychodera flava]|uniref:mannose-6-phosphate isomerase-like n=1 Tax=Ptychodera flava TaxID=63121 RepID=UPI00396A676A